MLFIGINITKLIDKKNYKALTIATLPVVGLENCIVVVFASVDITSVGITIFLLLFQTVTTG